MSKRSEMTDQHDHYDHHDQHNDVDKSYKKSKKCKLDLLGLTDRDLQCVVCIDLLLSPVSLECGHTMCLRCAQKLKNRKCPTCRQSFATLSKNILLCSILENLYGPEYNTRCNKVEAIQKYYGGERFDTLCDVITDMVSSGEQIPHDPNTKGIFITVESIITQILHTKLENVRYTIPEVKLCIMELINDKCIFQHKNYLLLNSTDWIKDKIIKYERFMLPEDILYILSPVIKSSWDSEIGSIIKTRRVKLAYSIVEDTEKEEDHIYELIKTKKIEL